MMGRMIYCVRYFDTFQDTVATPDMDWGQLDESLVMKAYEKALKVILNINGSLERFLVCLVSLDNESLALKRVIAVQSCLIFCSFFCRLSKKSIQRHYFIQLVFLFIFAQRIFD